MVLKATSTILAFLAVTNTAQVHTTNKIVCYYDSKGSFRSGDAHYSLDYLSEAAQYCTHLVYGYATINKKNYTLESSNPDFDIYKDKAYQHMVSLKVKVPNLRVLLSVGGRLDAKEIQKYTTLLEHSDKRRAFVSSSIELVKRYGFSGLDLAWPFPPNKPKIVDPGFWRSVWGTLKKPFVSEEVDAKSEEHKQQFVELVSELKNSCENHGLTLSLSVLPNVNSTLFFNIPEIIPNIDMVNLWAFDYYTAERNPKEADLPGTIYELSERKNDENGDYLVRHWCENGAPSHKIILGIPTFARTWKVSSTDTFGVPPVHDVNGPGSPGAHTKEAGLLSYMEMCHKLEQPNTITGLSSSVKEGSAKHKYASYALFASNGSKDVDTWAGYEDPDTANYKSTYARKNKLGGVAIVDLTLDDFSGQCSGIKYPLLRAALSGAIAIETNKSLAAILR